MIRVPCSQLEDVRKNPIIFAQKLSEDKAPGGSRGMFADWQTVIKEVHLKDISLGDAINSLQQKFLRFNITKDNLRKQEFLLDRLQPYCEEFNSLKYKYLGSGNHIKWKLIPNVMLTGLIPFTASLDNDFMAYFIVEKPISWKSQLKFPLLQYYLANNYFKCGLENLKIGTYCLETNRFDLKNYNQEEIEDAILETTDLFTRISDEYDRTTK
jgi:hypothetical protein